MDRYQKTITSYGTQVKTYNKEKKEIMHEAKEYEKGRDEAQERRENFRTFDHISANGHSSLFNRCAHAEEVYLDRRISSRRGRNCILCKRLSAFYVGWGYCYFSGLQALGLAGQRLSLRA